MDEFIEVPINLPSAGTYYVGCEANIAIYSVNVVVGGSLKTTDEGAVYADQENSYLLAAVSEDDLASDTLVLSLNDKEADSTSTVYTGAVVDNNYISGSDIDESAAYIYAVKVLGTSGVDISGSFTTALE